MDGINREQRRRGIRNLWALIALSTLAQINNWFPSWVTPDCRRVVLNYGDTAFTYAYFEDNDWHSSREPVSTQINEIDIHIDVHRIAIDAGSQLDGVYELGLGFLFLGQPAEWEGLRGYGQGNVYFWYSRLGDVPKKDW